MLKKFVLNALSSFVGAWLAIVLGIVATVVFIFAMMGKFAMSDGNAEKLTDNSVLQIDLSGVIEEVEKPSGLDINMLMRGDLDRPQTLNRIVDAIREGADNKKVKGIYLKCDGVSAAPATLHALRDALADFKKQNKFIYAYGGNYSQGDYYVASIADSIFMNPQGMLSLHGISGSTPFYKGLFDKLGVQFQVIKVGTFKSAVEPYIMDRMSEPARAQLDTLYTNIWSVMRGQMSQSRGFKNAEIDSLISQNVTFKKPEFLLKSKLVDRLVYERQMGDIIAHKIGEDDADDVNYVTTRFLSTQYALGAKTGGDQVAVLYATGEINETNDAGINCDKLVPEILELADDDDVKALVLRVNSPGGSVYGTEQIWEALEYFKQQKKPLIVSMGDYAASGGYWISSGADYIFADELTITGSIGIFGLIPEFQGLTQKIGVNIETVSTHPGADFPDLFHPMSDSQRNAMQEWINAGYDQFISRVAIGRKMPENKVRAIAEGRVWDAVSAKRIGLVNDFGTLYDAVEYAAKKAGIEKKYSVGVYPVLEPGIWNFLPSAEVMTMVQSLSGQFPNADMKTLAIMAKILYREPLQALMPEFTIDMR
ncbi:MAG: signal peptide peptidase SppA [Muribaculaceae bacterium]|nr:signal peptide peptidase SppA [Muribaculaceae bacterium]